MALGRLPRVMEIVSTIYTLRLVMCGHDVFVVASAINNIDCHTAQPDVASRHDDTKVLDQRICCGGGRKQTSFNAGAMALHCDGEGLRLVQSILPWAQSPIVVRGSSLPCTAYATLMRLIVTWHDVRGHLPLWRESRCCFSRRMWPLRRTRCTRPQERTCRSAYSLYSLSATYTPSSAYSPYSTSAYCCWSSRGAVWSSSHSANDNMKD